MSVQLHALFSKGVYKPLQPQSMHLWTPLTSCNVPCMPFVALRVFVVETHWQHVYTPNTCTSRQMLHSIINCLARLMLFMLHSCYCCKLSCPSRSTPSLLPFSWGSCKRNINPAHHRFDLPVTEESLAQRSLQQLKINSIKIIAKSEL